MSSAGFHRHVREKFSDAAETYEDLCSIQVDIARELADRLPLKDGARILDIGSGTGILASEVLKRIPTADVIALDAALKMVEAGRSRYGHLSWMQGDAVALPLRSESLDLVVSSSSYQWIGDLPLAFKEASRVLKKDGRFYAVLFSRATLSELFESFQAAGLIRGREEVFSLRRLPSEDDIRAALRQSDFQHRGVSRETREVIFRDLWSLLKWLKGIGANGLTRGFFLGGEFLAHVDDHYRERFGTSEGIRVTFEVLWIDAVK